jgi:hypothetical protein
VVCLYRESGMCVYICMIKPWWLIDFYYLFI